MKLTLTTRNMPGRGFNSIGYGSLSSWALLEPPLVSVSNVDGSLSVLLGTLCL